MSYKKYDSRAFKLGHTRNKSIWIFQSYEEKNCFGVGLVGEKITVLIKLGREEIDCSGGVWYFSLNKKYPST